MWLIDRCFTKDHGKLEGLHMTTLASPNEEHLEHANFGVHDGIACSTCSPFGLAMYLWLNLESKILNGM